ncbi:hypothetical protein [Streptacidiphilus anmyonensis]|uniref:hypothetical protein n=1 Tax=Streptacidiphilus anmyonensis TaxID=405782 RepID=UPI0005A8BBED|nr:hypothetical protein [Streptacidiphilus anmyonensis]
MSEPPPESSGQAAHVVVHPVTDADEHPFRRVDIVTAHVGVAHGLEDVLYLMRRAGLQDEDLDDPRLVEWHGGGPDVWH